MVEFDPRIACFELSDFPLSYVAAGVEHRTLINRDLLDLDEKCSPISRFRSDVSFYIGNFSLVRESGRIKQPLAKKLFDIAHRMDFIGNESEDDIDIRT